MKIAKVKQPFDKTQSYFRFSAFHSVISVVLCTNSQVHQQQIGVSVSELQTPFYSLVAGFFVKMWFILPSAIYLPSGIGEVLAKG